MTVSYENCGIYSSTKKDLQEAAHLTSHAMRKLSRDEAIATDTLAKYVDALTAR